jgi:protein SCO1/2
MSQPAASYRPAKSTAVIICMIIAALGVVVWFNYFIKVRKDMMKGRLPIKARVEQDLPKWVDQNGTERHLEQLKGKVIVWSYVYTTCPSGCAGIAAEMKKLQDEFGSHPRFHLISVSLFPEHDRPEMLKGWTETQGFRGDNWWFLTSPGGGTEQGDAIRKWMEKTFRIWTKKKDAAHIEKTPADVWDHPLVMALTDHKGHIRTPTENDSYWHPFHKAFGDSWYPRPIREDIKKLLEEAEND